MARQTQNVVLDQAYEAITNALNNPELREPLGHYGYDEAKLQEGLSYHARVKQLSQQRKRTTQTARETAALYQESKEHLIDLFQTHRDTARLAYKREAAYTDHLKLTGSRQTAVANLLAQADTFYLNVPVPMMEKYRVSRRELQETAQLVEQVRNLKALRQHTQGQVQNLTQTRLRALEALQRWMRHFLMIAKVALASQPQQLESLHHTVTS